MKIVTYLTGLVAVGTGAMAVAMASVKTIAKKLGRKLAIAWQSVKSHKKLERRTYQTGVLLPAYDRRKSWK